LRGYLNGIQEDNLREEGDAVAADCFSSALGGWSGERILIDSEFMELT
jgi:hypothetical protein